MRAAHLAIWGLLPAAIFAGTLREDFEDGDIRGWAVRGDWQIEDGKAVVSSLGNSPYDGPYLLIGDASWKDYTIEATITPEAVLSTGELAVVARAEVSGGALAAEAWGFRMDICWGGHRTTTTGVNWIKVPPPSCETGHPYRFRLTVSGSRYVFSIDGVPMADLANDAGRSGGAVGIALGGVRAAVDDISISGPEIPCDEIRAAAVDYCCARIDATPAWGVAPLEVLLDGGGSEAGPEASIASYEWTFEDGETAEGRTVRWTYDGPGVHLARLMVTDSRGLQDTAEGAIPVGLEPGDIAPWSAAPIGSPSGPIGARFDGDDLLVCGAGPSSLRGTDDAGGFVHQALVGDGAITARLKDLPIGPAGALVGVMVRGGLGPAAPQAAVLIHQVRAGRQRFQVIHRAEAGAGSWARVEEDCEVPDAWVRLERRGQEVIGLISSDGTAWTEVDRVGIDLPDSAPFGVFTTTLSGTAPYEFVEARLAVSVAPIRQAFRRADTNADGTVDLADAITALNYLFAGGPMTCPKAADANDDGQLDIADPVSVLVFLFARGAPPPAPFSACGTDPTADGLPCPAFPACP